MIHLNLRPQCAGLNVDDTTTMSGNNDFDEESSRRAYGRPYTSKHPVPTIQGYREHRAELKENLEATEEEQNAQDGQGESRARRAYDSVKAIVKNEDQTESTYNPYPTSNHNEPDRTRREQGKTKGLYDGIYADGSAHDTNQDNNNNKSDDNSKNQGKSATETAAGHVDPKQKRKDMKKIKRHGGGREVTDPVTHLPITIHDKTDKDLDQAPENIPASGSHHRTATGLSGASKSWEELDEEKREMDDTHRGMETLFPPPDFEDTRKEMARTYRLAMMVGLGSIVGLATLSLLIIMLLQPHPQQALRNSSRSNEKTIKQEVASRPWFSTIFVIIVTAAAGAGLTFGISGWLDKKVDEIFDDEVWDAARQREIREQNSVKELPESVAWLNTTLSSVWPLINPDLFSSLVDMLEDVMQASLPKVVRMVSVDDLGQGSESIRILGIKWLPTGAASQSVDADGNLIDAGDKQNDRTDPEQEQVQTDGQQNGDHPEHQTESEQQKQQERAEQDAIREGMEAEEGDFVNLELAFAYRARSSGKSIKTKAKNAHLYLKFYLPGGIAVPVWVELKGIVGTMRLRLQLTPDPPFFSLCTLTFLGQPRANLSCVPLSKHSLNLMDVPLISSFVQSAIDAALAEYVAPKSLTLDLKDMLIGDDFKHDTVSHGVVMVLFKKARGFKEGDGGFGPISGASDCYVTLSWAKFGKPVASTRILVDEQEPNWDEWHSILVSPDELNAEEKLRVQIWDSDKFTADDDLGRVEVDLKKLIHSEETRNKMCDREDQLKGEDPDEDMPGTMTWAVGYFEKAHIQQCQLKHQKVDKNIHTKEELKAKISKLSEDKLREANVDEESKELRQQKVQDYREQEDAMIISAPPPHDLHSGIFSIQIHNVTGLEVQKLNKRDKGDELDDREDEAEQNDNLPDSYCNVILNQKKIYRTRTKPKNSKPFFNAGTERFVKDWRTTEVMISVRDSRERENDPLLGMVYLPLGKVFAKRSQVVNIYPLAGGIGYGRIRISMVWRSVELKLSPELSGWDLGTLAVKGPVRIKNATDLDSLKSHRIKLRTNLGKVKMYPDDPDSGNRGTGEWRPRSKETSGEDDDNVFMAVRRRYASPLVIEFRTSSFGPDRTPAFAVLWLSKIPDEEEKTISLKVWKGGKHNLKRAENCSDYAGLEPNEQPLGEIELTCKFWRGLSGYHKKYAEKQRSSDMRDVMELLDTVSDEKMAYDDGDSQNDKHDTSDSDSDSDSDSSINQVRRVDSQADAATRKNLQKKLRASDDSDESSASDPDKNAVQKLPGKMKKQMTKLIEGDSDIKDDGSRGARAQVKDYMDHRKQLHRKGRGAMQWKSARTLDWMAGKVKRGKGRVEDMFHHGEKDQGIETEV